ncbi:LLM class flavin-dependent oxidoreductase [Isoptericola aurantiacus]|uniref:LLM class flavin-dependent oxidoreductase n=1 Tax=Isoptericola aurantiacus TaxID=3377839 RepID=UPI00383A077E
MPRPVLRLGLSLSPTWLRGAAWRREDSRVEDLYTARDLVRAAVDAEAAGVDFVFKPDAPSLDVAALAGDPGFSGPEPTVLLTAVAAVTSRIGLVTTVSTTFAHPYATARTLYSLDQLSGGRVGWNAVTALGGHEQYLRGEMPSSSERYARALELVDVVQRLGESFPPEAVIVDREQGRYADVGLIRRIDHDGDHFRVAGPLTTPARGRLPLLQAGGSPAGRDLAARVADGVFAATPDADDGVALRRDLATRAVAHGRDADAVAVLPGLSLFLAGTRPAARELFERSAGRRGAAHWTVVGTPDDAAEQIADRAAAGALDGVIALPGGSVDSLRLFLQEVVPALDAAGLHAGGRPWW